MLLALLFAATVLGPADVESLAAAADAVVYGQVVRRAAPGRRRRSDLHHRGAAGPIETWKGASGRRSPFSFRAGEVGRAFADGAGRRRFQ